MTEFLEKLLKLPSHYCRKSTSRLYFEPYIKSMSQLYNMYIIKCNEENKQSVSRKIFADVYDKTNFSAYHPKKYCIHYGPLGSKNLPIFKSKCFIL